MARYCGKVGYAVTKEQTTVVDGQVRGTGIWLDQIVERLYYGDYMRNPTMYWRTANKSNDDIDMTNQVSIVADPFAMSNFHCIKYAEFMGTRWKVTNVEIEYPRLILALGGVYNGEEPSEPTD